MAFQLWSLLYFIPKCSQCSRNPSQPCWIATEYCLLLLHESHTAQQQLPGSLQPTCSPQPQPHLINLPQAPRWDLAPCICCFRAIRWGLCALSHLTCMKTPITQLQREKPREASQNFYFAHSQQLKIPAKFVLVADELLQLLQLCTSSFQSKWCTRRVFIANVIIGYFGNQNDCTGHSILFVIFVKYS